jgi:hypothetical protein
MSEDVQNADYVPPVVRREERGRRVREVWIEWARDQPNPKPSWLVPYDDLSETDKEADRRIGSALWGDGFRAGVDFGLKQANEMLKATPSDGSGATS